ncbi:hypothetical protein ES703_86229 [subsurface metagenome]
MDKMIEMLLVGFGVGFFFGATSIMLILGGRLEMQKRVHRCKQNSTDYSLEDRGDGWYLYLGDSRGENRVDSCPWCGRPMIHWPFQEKASTLHI